MPQLTLKLKFILVGALATIAVLGMVGLNQYATRALSLRASIMTVNGATSTVPLVHWAVTALSLKYAARDAANPVARLFLGQQIRRGPEDELTALMGLERLEVVGAETGGHLPDHIGDLTRAAAREDDE